MSSYAATISAVFSIARAIHCFGYFSYHLEHLTTHDLGKACTIEQPLEVLDYKARCNLARPQRHIRKPKGYYTKYGPWRTVIPPQQQQGCIDQQSTPDIHSKLEVRIASLILRPETHSQAISTASLGSLAVCSMQIRRGNAREI